MNPPPPHPSHTPTIPAGFILTVCIELRNRLTSNMKQTWIAQGLMATTPDKVLSIECERSTVPAFLRLKSPPPKRSSNIIPTFYHTIQQK